MQEQIVALCRQLGAGEEQDVLLLPLAQAAYIQLSAGLKEGVAPEDCGEAFPMACAMAAMGVLREITGENAVSSFTAGEVTIRRELSTCLARSARSLLAPWMRDGGFCFLEVPG